MPIAARLFRRDALEERLEIGANVASGVLLDEQSSGGVPAEQGQKSGLHLMGPQPTENMIGNFHKASRRCRDLKDVGKLPHVADVRCRSEKKRSLGNTSVNLALLERPHVRSSYEGTMRLIILIILIILVLGALPTWPYSSGWGYYPAGGLGTILIILLILALLGVI
jgi:Protein of unknown function (DUF3309)